MKHYLLSRSAYGPEVSLEFNRYRLGLTAGITVPSLAAQTRHDVTWLVLVDPADPLIEERTEVLKRSGLDVLVEPAKDIKREARFDEPWGPWHDYLDWSDALLTSRIDDDDAYAPWVLDTFRESAERYTASRRARGARRIFVLPVGYRVADGRVNLRHDRVNQFSTMYAPRGDKACIMDMNHSAVRRLARVIILSRKPSWLWFRHDGARSAGSNASTRNRETMVAPSDEVRRTFPIDWAKVGA